MMWSSLPSWSVMASRIGPKLWPNRLTHQELTASRTAMALVVDQPGPIGGDDGARREALVHLHLRARVPDGLAAAFGPVRLGEDKGVRTLMGRAFRRSVQSGAMQAGVG